MIKSPRSRCSGPLGPLLIGAVFATLAAGGASAQETTRPPAKSGFSGFVSVLGGYVNQKSQFNTAGKNRRTSNLDNSGQSDSEGVPIVLGEVRYSFASARTQIYGGVPLDNIREGTFFPELGVRYWLEGGTRLTAATLWQPILPPKTWEDPFVVDQRRKRTDANSFGVKLAADRILGTGLGLRYELATRNLDDDQSGRFLADQPGSTLTSGDLDNLKRDAIFNRLTATYTAAVSETVKLRPALRYTIGNADGGSNSFMALRPEFGVIYAGERNEVSLNLRYERSDFNKKNPVFGEKRDENTYSAFVTYRYKRPFDIDHLSISALAVVSYGDSDIKFYDNRFALVGLGVAYAF